MGATFNTSPTGSTIHYNWHRLCRTHRPTIGIHMQQVNTQGLHCHIFVTQAVHIEVVTSLTTEAFLAVLRYFITRRRRLRVIYSDIGTNVQGVQLAPGGTTHFNVQPRWRGSRILTTEGCNWKFIPLHGPHFGDLWEAAVNTTCDKSRCTRLPPMKNLAPC